ncbi:hypothetical protein LSAT2_014858 [Lamellibrachia satsuma]|nr:hypothetical protein LSAT2_014858 [Lamellibrachia satsuma]
MSSPAKIFECLLLDRSSSAKTVEFCDNHRVLAVRSIELCANRRVLAQTNQSEQQFDSLIMVVAWIILIVLASMLPTHGTWSYSQYCEELCEMYFYECITETCPSRPRPLAIPQHCIDERLECLETCL